MQIKVEMDGAIVIVNMDGKLVASTAEELKGMINRLLERKFTRVLIDMKRVDFIDSSGLGALISTNRMLAETSGKLVCCGLNNYIRKIFQITRAEQKIATAASRSEGLRMLYL